MDTKGALIVALLLFVAVFVLFAGMPVVDHNSSVQHNKANTATVQGTDIDERTNDDEREYSPVVVYEYTVNGEQYESSNVYPGQFTRWHGSRSAAADVVSEYTAGQQVTVQYNPNNPEEAYLQNNGWPSGWYFAAGGAVVVLLGGGYFIRLGFRRWRQRTLIRDTPAEQAQSLSVGPSEVTGTAVPTPEGPMTAPFSDEDCLVAEYEVEEYDSSDDDSSWETRDQGTFFCPFFVEDETGTVLVRPHEETNYDLDPDDWSTVYVDSASKGPEPVQWFVENSDGLEFPSDASGKDNDRKYRQNLIRTRESVYVFGTVRPREQHNVPDDASNADRLVIEKIADDSMQEPMFLVSDDEEHSLVDRRRWALWRAPVGGVFLVFAFAVLLLMAGPLFGVETPRVFDGIINSVSQPCAGSHTSGPEPETLPAGPGVSRRPRSSRAGSSR